MLEVTGQRFRCCLINLREAFASFIIVMHLLQINLFVIYSESFSVYQLLRLTESFLFNLLPILAHLMSKTVLLKPFQVLALVLENPRFMSLALTCT